jgi:RNA polymerase sigma factor (sigma-70 family)
MSQEPSNILNVIRACAAGDQQARRRFQEEYGEDIYHFPAKIYGLPLERAGDFYLYVFDRNRIFSRLETFQGLNRIQFRTFLSYYVLKSLFLEWLRAEKEVATISRHALHGDVVESSIASESVLNHGSLVDDEQGSTQGERRRNEPWDSLSAEERLDLKLLYLIECELAPEDIRLLSNISGRSILDTLALVAEVREALKRKDEKAAHLRNELDMVWGWIVRRQQGLQEIDEKILLMKETRNFAGQQQLLGQRAILERSLVKRYQQRDRILQEIRNLKLTTSYKDIARLLNMTVGTVGSRIFRLRRQLIWEVREKRGPQERAL